MNLKKIENLAYEVLNEFNIEEPSVPVKKIARKLGIRVVQENFNSNISGILHRDIKKNITTIGINTLHGINRQRFTIAHEIGHFLLHEGKILYIDKGAFKVNYRNNISSMAINQEEIEANAFAAALLMPKKFIVREIDARLKYGLDISDDYEDEVQDIAKLFKVSPQALYIRLGNLGYI